MAMKIGGGSGLPSSIDETNGAAALDTAAAEPQPATTAAPPEAPVNTALPYNPGGQLAEHFLAGQMRSLMFTTGGFGSGGGGTTGTPAPAPRNLSEGSRGADVQQAEDQLNQWRSDNGKKPIKADGKYDGQTATAVRDFQKHNDLDVDGSIGPNTRDRLALESDASFKNLDPDTKKQVRDEMKGYSKDQVSRDNLKQLATDPNFAKLTPDLQQKALKNLASNPQDTANLNAIRKNAQDRATLEGNPKFQALGDETKKEIRKRMDKYENNPTERQSLMTLAGDENFGKLSRSNQHRAMEALSKSPTFGPNLANLQTMIGSNSFQKMDEGMQERVLDMAIKNAGNPTYIGDLSKLTSDPKFGNLNPVDRGKTLNVFAETTPQGRIALQALMQRTTNGIPAITTHGVNPGSPSLLDQLDRLSKTPLDARLKDRAGNPIPHSKVTEQLLQEVSDPSNYIQQANRGTCTCTSMSHRLAIRNPAEYARLTTDLATTGSAKLANGDTINVPGQSAWLPAPPQDTRPHTERLLQSSLMDYARPGKGYVNHNNGPDGTFGTPDDGFVDPKNPTGPRNMDGWRDRPMSGLDSNEEKRVLKGMFNKHFDFYTGSFNFKDDKKDIMNKIRGVFGQGGSYIDADLGWGNGGHAVEVYKVANGRVYIRNPWGPGGVGATGNINGTAANNTGQGPLRRVENGSQGEESMTIADFEKAVRGVYVSD